MKKKKMKEQRRRKTEMENFETETGKQKSDQTTNCGELFKIRSFILFYFIESRGNIETEILEMKTEMKRNDTASEQDAMGGPIKLLLLLKQFLSRTNQLGTKERIHPSANLTKIVECSNLLLTVSHSYIQMITELVLT